MFWRKRKRMRGAAIWLACIAAAGLAYVNALPYITAVADYAIVAIVLPAVALLTAMPLVMSKYKLGPSADVAIEPASGLVALTLYLCLGPAQFLMGQ